MIGCVEFKDGSVSRTGRPEMAIVGVEEEAGAAEVVVCAVVEGSAHNDRMARM